jgi:homoserine O-acetyltransferase
MLSDGAPGRSGKAVAREPGEDPEGKAGTADGDALMVLRRVCPFRIVGVLLACASIAGAQSAKQEFGSIGDFKLENGEVIRDCHIGYRTFGKLNAARSNAVLFPTWFTGRTQNLEQFVGPDKLIDPAAFYVVLMDALADGVSSSPSNSRLQPRSKFPRISIRDMVHSQHELLTRVLKVDHVRAIIGISMGGMQTFQWIVSYPGFMDRAIPIVGTPAQTSYDLLLWQAEANAIESDPSWRGGEYSGIPAGMKTVADIHALAISTPEHMVEQVHPDGFRKYLGETEQTTVKSFDANDWLWQLRAMMGHNVGGNPVDFEGAARAVNAKLLVVAGLRDHMVNPRPALQFARFANARTIELDSDCGHLAPSCEAAKIYPAVRKFLAE